MSDDDKSEMQRLNESNAARFAEKLIADAERRWQWVDQLNAENAKTLRAEGGPKVHKAVSFKDLFPTKNEKPG